MYDILERVISKFENEVKAQNEVRHSGPFRRMKIAILGQQALLVRRETLPKLKLLATNDFDGLLNGEPPLEDIFKRILKEEGLTYDEQSRYIWLPDETGYELIYQSDFVEVDSPAPIYLIVSKAVKAPEKNKQLVREAIEQFGDDLLGLLEKYKVNLNYFVGE